MTGLHPVSYKSGVAPFYLSSLNPVICFILQGCTFVCVFGLPHAMHEDDAQRALRAAKEAYRQLEKMDLRWARSPTAHLVALSVTQSQRLSGRCFCVSLSAGNPLVLQQELLSVELSVICCATNTLVCVCVCVCACVCGVCACVRGEISSVYTAP